MQASLSSGSAEYLVAEVVELGGKSPTNNAREINVRHITRAVCSTFVRSRSQQEISVV